MYGGRANYETWATMLWLDNVEPFYNYVRQLARDTGNSYSLANKLKDFVDDIVCSDQPESGLTADLFRAAFEEIDWREMAESILHEIDEENS